MCASTSLKDFRRSVLNIRKSVHLAAMPATERLIDCGAMQNFDIKYQSTKLCYDLCETTFCEYLLQQNLFFFIFYRWYVSENWESIQSRYLFLFDYALEYAITFWLQDKPAPCFSCIWFSNRLSFIRPYLRIKLRILKIYKLSPYRSNLKKFFFKRGIFSLITVRYRTSTSKH